MPESLLKLISTQRARNRAAVAEAIMLAISGAITPAEAMERVDASHDECAVEYLTATHDMVVA